MKILIAPDKFKGSLTAQAACDAIAEGLRSVDPSNVITSIPLADGGEGTCELLTGFFHGKKVTVKVKGPHFENIAATYGLSRDGTTAFIEMANASGLQLVKVNERNPLHTTSYGTGELIIDAINKGARKIIMGIGGSATNEAGMGMAEALGYEFFDDQHLKLKPVGESLIHLSEIDASRVDPRIKDTEFVGLCDVDNPFSGIHGAAFAYGPQKGANEETVRLLDQGLKNFEKVITRAYGISVDFPGAGAGGGLPGAAKVFLNIQIKRGMQFIVEMTGLKQKVIQSDLIITGEGKVDHQTLAGKVVMEVARLAHEAQKPVLVVCGTCELSSTELENLGVTQLISLVDQSTPYEMAYRHAHDLIVKRLVAAYPSLPHL